MAQFRAIGNKTFLARFGKAKAWVKPNPQGCAIENGWCFISLKFKRNNQEKSSITEPTSGNLGKKHIFSVYCRNKNTHVLWQSHPQKAKSANIVLIVKQPLTGLCFQCWNNSSKDGIYHKMRLFCWALSGDVVISSPQLGENTAFSPTFPWTYG